ncbi:MAG: SDR family oxidoreductase [Myxococcota bacterium]|nr:SDR family oxidoreductase [Myxococcota bacterium]
MKDLSQKVAIVTGGARGTGAAIAKALARHGTRVLIGDIRDEDGTALVDEIGSSAGFVHHDVSVESDWSAIVDQAIEAHGRLDILVNNAAVLHLGRLDKTPVETLRRLLEVNTIGPYLGIQAVLPAMRSQQSGSIVNVGSLDSLMGMNGITAYCTSKWALRGLSKAAALEMGREGIRINTVCPAGGNPEMYEPWYEDLASFMAESQAYIADRAIPGEVPMDQIAEAVCFFASDASQHCTGVDLPVDGGAHAGHFIPGFNRIPG